MMIWRGGGKEIESGELGNEMMPHLLSHPDFLMVSWQRTTNFSIWNLKYFSQDSSFVSTQFESALQSGNILASKLNWYYIFRGDRETNFEFRFGHFVIILDITDGQVLTNKLFKREKGDKKQFNSPSRVRVKRTSLERQINLIFIPKEKEQKIQVPVFSEVDEILLPGQWEGKIQKIGIWEDGKFRVLGLVDPSLERVDQIEF